MPAPPSRCARAAARLLAGGLLLGGLACSGGSGDPARPLPRCDEVPWRAPRPDLPVVLVVDDTLRRDRLGAYGGPAETPRFDAFAADAWLFEEAWSQAPWTKPSVATLFTALYPSQHGVLSHPLAPDPAVGKEGQGGRESDALPEGLVTLAEVFREAGYRTGAFVANPWMERRFGFAQGFEVYDDSSARWGRGGEAVNRAAADWLDGLPADAPFLLYVHYIDTHRPYPALRWEEVVAGGEELLRDARPLPPAARREIREQVRFEAGAPPAAELVEPTRALLERAYDRGVERFDALLGALLDGLAARGLGERAVVVVTSDHGEALFERGWGNHGRGLFEEEIAVPLAVRVPGEGSGRVRCPVGLLDLMPSLCGLLWLPCPEGLAGRSFLAGEGAEDAPGRYLVAEGVAGKPGNRAVRSRTLKLLHQPDGAPLDGPSPGGEGSDAFSLYDLERDPAERRDLLEDGGEPARRWRAALEAGLERAVPPPPGVAGERAPVDPALEERLRELGYIE